MNKGKGKSNTKTAPLQVVGVVYNHNKEDRSLRLLDFLQAGSNFADRINAKAEEEEVERLKAENDQRVEELLAKAKDIKQRSLSESENLKDTTAMDQSETGNLEQKSKSKTEKNGNVNKAEKPHSKADAIERLRKMEWKRCQEDHKSILSNLRSNNGRQEFPPLAKGKQDEEYFSGTKVKKTRERKKNREEMVVSLDELKKCGSTMPVSEKTSKLTHTIPPPSNSCWQNKPGATLFASAKNDAGQDAEDAELNWALRESLREQEEQQKRFMEILAGSRVERNRKPPGTMIFPPPEPNKEEDWDADESDYVDAEENIGDSKTEDKYLTEIKGKQMNKGSELKVAGNIVSRTCVTSTANDELLNLYDNGEQRNVTGIGHLNNAQHRMNKLATNLSEKLKQKEAQSSNISTSHAPPYHNKREQTHFGRTHFQHDDMENKGENGLPQRVSESLKNKSYTVHRQDDAIKSVKHASDHESLIHSNRSHGYRNIHDIPSSSSQARKDDDLSPKMLSLESASEQKHISQSDAKKDISQSFSVLHIETGGWEEEKLAHRNSAGSHESSASSLSADKVSHFETKTQGSSAADMQYLTQGREQLSSAAARQYSAFSAQGISASAEEKQLQPVQSVPGQSGSPDTVASLIEELQRIKMYQNFLMQLRAQESLQAAMQQQLESMSSGLTQEQLQTMLQMQHQQTLMPDLHALLQQQTQNAPLYAPVQYPGIAVPNPRDTAELSRTPPVSPGSSDNATMVQKQFQELLQQHPNALLHSGFPVFGGADKELTQQQQLSGMAQPGTQASTTVHLSLQTSYPNAPQSGFVAPTQYPQPMLMQQQYAPNMHAAKPPSPQSLAGVPSNATNAAMSAVEATQYPQSMFLQQQYAPNMHAAKPPSPQSLAGAPSNATNAAMAAVQAAQYPQSMFLQQQFLPNMLSGPQSPQSLTGAPSNLNPTATNIAMEATQYNMRAQLMTAGMYNQQPAQHTMAGLVPAVPQEKPKCKGRGRLLH